MTHKFFKKPCMRCDNTFTPTGKYQKLCHDCRDQKHSSKEHLKKKYFQTKITLDKIRDNATLSNWKALSHGYKLGKQIWGSKFTRQRLAEDMDMRMTTVLRCLSLDRANPKSIKLMDEGKISASKLSMITLSKCRTFQDEIVAAVIEDGLSTLQIKTLKINNIKDVSLEKLRLATEEGFSRESSTIRSFENWIEKGNLLLMVKKSALNQDKFIQIRDKLKNLNQKIDRYIDE